MGNLCCRRVGYSPNGVQADQGRSKDHHHNSQSDIPQHPPKVASGPMSNSYHNADDCAINELLEGRMDLDVILPDSRKVRLTVERRTPMMDLLVQAASATKISPAGHTIHVFGDNKGSGTLPYKPSTPIGSLDANTICIVAKKDAQDSTIKRNTKTANRPFEPTFRVQVHLPRNQLTVLRLSPRVRISELRNQVCQEKGLDVSRYQLVRPSDPGQPLDGNMTLAEYGSTEVTLLSNSCIESHICNSNSHIMPYAKRADDQKKKTGILRLLAEDASHTTQIGTSRPTPPTTKAFEKPHQGRYKPKKRRPAPPPPPPFLPLEQPPPPFHSRQSSSDSSGYHEATSSYLHDEQCAPLEPAEKASSDSSGVSSLDAKPPLSSVVKKRKAPLPPPAGKECQAEDPRQDTTEGITEVPSKDEISPVIATPTPKLKKECASKWTEPSKKSPKEHSSDISITEGEAVTRVALAALNARIEQDVTQREIASNIQAAFHSLDSPQKSVPSLLAIKQRNEHNSLRNAGHHHEDYDVSTAESIEQPPPSVGLNSRDTSAGDRREKVSLSFRDKSGQAGGDRLGYNSLSALNSVSKVTPGSYSDKTGEHLNGIIQSNSDRLPLKLKLSKPSAPHSVNGFLHTNGGGVAALGNCKSSTDRSTTSAVNSPPRNISQVRNGNLTSEDTQSQCYPLQKSSASHHLKVKDEPITGEGLEVFPPPPTQFRGEETQEPDSTSKKHRQTTTVNLRRSSSLLNLSGSPFPKGQLRTNEKKGLQRSLSDLSAEDKDEFGAEQERLQREYVKLQRQFVLWQQQLLNNHAMLREECIVQSQYARTFRQSHSLPEGEDYSDEAQIPCPLVTRSLSYEPTNNKCSTLPRSSINIPDLEFGPVSLTNGSGTLRSSKTKSYFKPPQVRVSTKNRQRLPPEIRKDGDMDIFDDAKILSTILPSLKLIRENTDNVNEEVSRLNGALPDTKLENLRNSAAKKVPPIVPNKTVSVSRHKNIGDRNENGHSNLNGQANTDKVVNGRLNGNVILNGITNGEHVRCVNGQDNELKGLNGQLLNGAVPPPPPVPLKETSRGHQVVKPNKGPSRNDVKQQVDPREELMHEIRRCGGRTALRKISLDLCS